MKGRPKKTVNDLPSNWREMILHIGHEGGLLVHVQTALGISRDTMSRMRNEEPEFAEVMEEYLQLSEKWWVDKAIESFETNKSKMFNQHLWSFIVRNRFPYHWKEKTEMDITSNGEQINAQPIQIEILKSQDK